MTDVENAALRFLPEDEALAARLSSGKFAQARRLLRRELPEPLWEAVNALADAYGDVGWAAHGSVFTVLRWAVRGRAGRAGGAP